MTDFESPYYVRCIDPSCPDAYAYRDPYPEVPHYHYIGPKTPDET